MRRLRDQRAGDAGQRSGDSVDREAPAGHRGADRVHAPDILADAGQRAPERRMDDLPRHQPTQEEHGQAIGVTRVTKQIEAKPAEYRPDLHALQPIVAAGDKRGLVDRFGYQLRYDQGLHQQG